jgi:hypothetical protein
MGWNPRDTGKTGVIGNSDQTKNVLLGGSIGADPGTEWSRISGQDGKNQKNADAAKAAKAQNDAMGGVYQGMNDADDAHLKDMKQQGLDYNNQTFGNSQKYGQQLDQLTTTANDQATDAQKTYTDTIRPNMVNAMEGAKKEAGDAMSLKDAGDANNSVQKGVRGMYEQQAQGVGRQGLADAGVLAALGAQATQGQMGSTPMTGGQMSAMYGQNQAQSSQAVMRAQQQAQGLREQGIDAGFRESAAQYDRGQGAKDRYQQTIGNLQNSQGVNQNQQTGYRQEIGGYNQQGYQNRQGQINSYAGTNAGLSQLGYQQSQNKAGRQTNLITGQYGPQIQAAQQGAAQIGANQAAGIGAIGTVAGGVLGGMAGGPVGAAAGASAGGGAANGMMGNGPQTSGNYQGTAGYYGRTA